MPDDLAADLRLHLDADTSRKALHRALLERGHDVTRTPCEWMPLDAIDSVQLRRAADRVRAIFTFNVRDFMALHRTTPEHCGIILAAQQSWTLSELVAALDALLSQTRAHHLRDQLIWLRRMSS